MSQIKLPMTSPRLRENDMVQTKSSAKAVSKCYFTMSTVSKRQLDLKRERTSSMGTSNLPFKPSSKKERLLSVMSARSGSSGSTITMTSNLGKSQGYTQSTEHLTIPKPDKKLYVKLPSQIAKTQIIHEEKLLQNDPFMSFTNVSDASVKIRKTLVASENRLSQAQAFESKLDRRVTEFHQKGYTSTPKPCPIENLFSNTSTLSERKTKVICTISDKCSDVATLKQLLDQGMNVARFKVKESNLDEVESQIRNFLDARAAQQEESLTKPCEIYLDTSGVKFQTGKLKYQYDGSVKINQGQTLKIWTDKNIEGSSQEIGCSNKDLIKVVHPGMEIEIGCNGALHCKVKAIFEDRVEVECLNDFTLNEYKTINIPGAKKGQEEEQAAIQANIYELCTKYPIDKVGLSFVDDEDVVKEFKYTMSSLDKKVQIVSKIDSLEGIKNYEGILRESDAIKIDRTSLNHEIPTEKLFAAQKYMIEKANLAGKPFITSSHLLESMATHPKPSRADVSDVSSAVVDGSDYVILSSKAVKGQYIFRALDSICNCCLEAEKMMEFRNLNYHDKAVAQMMEDPETVEKEAMPSSWMKEINTFFDKDEYKFTGQVVDLGMRLKFAGALAIPIVAQATEPLMHMAMN